MKFADKAIFYTGSHVLGSMLQLIMGMIMVRYLSKYDYGTFRQVMLLAVLTSSTLAIGLPQCLPYFIPKASSSREKKELAFQVFVVLSVLGVLAACGMYAFRSQIGEAFNNPDLATLAGIWCVYFLLLFPSKCAEETLISIGRITSAALLNTVTVILEFVAVVGGLLWTQSLEVVLLVFLVIYGLRLVAEISILATLEGGRPQLWNWNLFKKQVSYSVPLGGSVLTGVIRTYTDKFLVSFLYAPETFAIYARGAFELPLVKILPYTLGGLIIPKISEHHKEGNISKIIYLWQEKARSVALVFFPLFVCTFIFAEPFISILFTKAYAESTQIFRIYLCLLPFRIVQYRAILQGIGQTKPILTATWVSMVMTIILCVVFYRPLGVNGLALAMVMGELMGSFYMLWCTKMALELQWSDLIPVKKLMAPLGCASLLGILVLPLAQINDPGIVILAAAGVLYFGLYIVVMRIGKFFTESDWDLICRWATFQVLRKSNS